MTSIFNRGWVSKWIKNRFKIFRFYLLSHDIKFLGSYWKTLYFKTLKAIFCTINLELLKSVVFKKILIGSTLRISWKYWTDHHTAYDLQRIPTINQKKAGNCLNQCKIPLHIIEIFLNQFSAKNLEQNSKKIP